MVSEQAERNSNHSVARVVSMKNGAVVQSSEYSSFKEDDSSSIVALPEKLKGLNPSMAFHASMRQQDNSGPSEESKS